MHSTDKANQPIWHFPPTGGGYAYIEDPALVHFRDRVFEQFIREVLQNSTDARDHNFETVHVEFRETIHSTTDINASALIPHIEASINTLKEEGKHPLIQQYTDAISALRQPTIRCLDVSDANTIGLQEPQWQALIYKAGSNQKGNNPTAGGTHGIGKFAAFNISIPRTAFYHTCFQQGNGRSAQRVERWIGKCLLATHQIGGDDLQHTGFYRHADQAPILAPNIPVDFRFHDRPQHKNLPTPSTTISVIGFQPHVADWVTAAKLATTVNFFAAIQRRLLTVTITDLSNESITIDDHSIPRHFDELMQKASSRTNLRNAYEHYRTLSTRQHVKTFHIPEPINSQVEIAVRVNTHSTKCAYINANGMFITKHFAVNLIGFARPLIVLPVLALTTGLHVSNPYFLTVSAGLIIWSNLYINVRHSRKPVSYTEPINTR